MLDIPYLSLYYVFFSLLCVPGSWPVWTLLDRLTCLWAFSWFGQREALPGHPREGERRVGIYISPLIVAFLCPRPQPLLAACHSHSYSASWVPLCSLGLWVVTGSIFLLAPGTFTILIVFPKSCHIFVKSAYIKLSLITLSMLVLKVYESDSMTQKRPVTQRSKEGVTEEIHTRWWESQRKVCHTEFCWLRRGVLLSKCKSNQVIPLLKSFSGFPLFLE